MSEQKKIDWESIEKKWISRWDSERLFEAEPDESRKKYFVTVAYPYPNSPQHIGHGRTYTLADAHARFMRMRGYNVLFPMGFHYTGTPILGMSRRVAAGDAELLETFRRIYELDDGVVATFVEPVRIASYFHNEIKQGMKEMGYSIDWRREFTTIDAAYSKFISWQFRTLKKKGLIVQGSHPVGWCPNDQNPVSQHDTMGDVEPDFNEYVLVKFRLEQQGDGNERPRIMPAATLRPETLFGVTNLWVNPHVDYVLARVDKVEEWIVSREAARKLEFLNHKIEIVGTIRGGDIVGKRVINPINSELVQVYPADFVEEESGTGIVMSVPAHAPYDFDALGRLRSDSELRAKYSLGLVAEPVKVIESDSYAGETIPAELAISQAKSAAGDVLEKATTELYSHEFYKGVMNARAGQYAGSLVSEAKVKIKDELISRGSAEIMYELANRPVRCRCGAECVVKILTDQWFLNYGDKEWKSLAHECIGRMDIVPQEIRGEFDYVIDWLKERACARRSGLGTKLPWDPDWIIESLSDSVIYMAYYIIAKYVNAGELASSSLDGLHDSFFDFVMLGSGSLSAVAKENGLPQELVARIRGELKYFYPVDSRHSGRDLVPNHLSFFIFNHVAIFPAEKWPRQIVVNGSVLMDGKKMSKSLGNIIPLRAAIKENGADPIRLAMLVSAELLQDADFSFDALRGIKYKLSGILDLASSVAERNAAEGREEPEDLWLASRLEKHKEETTRSMEKLRVREAIHTILYVLETDLGWYLKRASAKGRNKRDSGMAKILRQYCETQVQMLAPFAPFTADEAWQRMGNSDLVQKSGWPVPEPSRINLVAEEAEFLTQSMISDIQNILRVAKINAKKVVVYVASPWKVKVYVKALGELHAGKMNFGELMKAIIADPETSKAKTDPNLVKKIMDDILAAPVEARERRLKLAGPNQGPFDEAASVLDAASLIGLEAGDASVQVYSEEDAAKYDPKSRAKGARPFKPAIYIE
ncbi:MAG: leucine--tRNA ligase [Nitrososphaera sp.]